MTASIGATDELQERVKDVVGRLDLPLQVVTDGDATLQVVAAEGGARPESTVDTLYAGGWIACPTALELAEKLQVDSHKFGALVNSLDIKIKRCQLGCF